MSTTSTTLELPLPPTAVAAGTYVDRLLATLEAAGERSVLVHAGPAIRGAGPTPIEPL
jgi:hypothetical protein